MAVKIEILDYEYGIGKNTADVNNYSSYTANMFAVINGQEVETFAAGAAGLGYFNNFYDVVEGVNYTVSFRISGYGGTGQMGFSMTGGIPSTLRGNADGTYTDTFTATASLSLDLFAYDTNSGYMKDISVRVTNTVDWEKSIVGELDVTDHSDFPLALTFQISDIKDLTSTSGDYSKTFKIPATKHNNQLLKNIYTSGVITDNKVTDKKKCRILVNDLYSLFGLIQVTGDGGYGEKAAYYNCVFFGSNLNWADSLSGKYMSDIDWGADGEDLPYNKTSIMATWDDTDCTSSDSYIVYPITSYGDYNGGGNGIDRTIQLLDTAYGNGTGGSTALGYSGFYNGGGSLSTPPPIPDWRPSVFVKDTLDKIFDGAGDGYKISSTFMNTDMFKKLVWLLPNFKYNNIEERFSLYSAEAEFIPIAALPYQTITALYISNTPFWTTKPLELGTLSTYFNFSSTTSSTDIVYSNFTGSGGGGSRFEIAEYGYYNLRMSNWTAAISNVTSGGSSSFANDETLGINYFRLAVQVKTVGYTSWNTIEYVDAPNLVSHSIGSYAFWLGKTNQGISPAIDNNISVDFPSFQSSPIFLNDGDELRVVIQVKLEGLYSGVGEDWVFRINPNPNNADLNIELKPEIVEYGQTYDLKDVMNPEYKQVDFIKGIAHAFNLKMTTDEVTRTINIEPFDSFYLPYGDAIDWTHKLDRSKEISDAWLKTDLKRNLVFKYKTDSEDKNVENRGNVFFKEILDEYPYQEELPNTFEKGDSVFENPFFAGTFNSKDQDTVRYAPVDTAYSACLWTEITSSNDWTRPNKGYEFLPRLLYWNKYSPVGDGGSGGFGIPKRAEAQTWATATGIIAADSTISVGGIFISNIYPQATMVDRDKTASPVLSYGNIWVRDYDAAAGTYASPVVGEGLYHTYYNNMIEMLKQNPRLRTAYIDLKITDVISLDFRKLVYIDGVYWKINKILDYQPNNNQATKVELMEWFQLGIFAANAPAITTFVGGIGVNVGGGIIDDSNNNMGL